MKLKTVTAIIYCLMTLCGCARITQSSNANEIVITPVPQPLPTVILAPEAIRTAVPASTPKPIYTSVPEREIVSPSKSPNSEIPSNAIELYYDGGKILCATSQENYKQLMKYLVANDSDGFNTMFVLGQGFNVPSKTKAVVLERKLTIAKVKIYEGDYKGKTVWVAIEAVD